MKTKNLITGLLIGLILFAGFVSAEDTDCEANANEYKEKLDAGGLGTNIAHLAGDYVRAARCYRDQGNHERAVEMCDTAKQWFEKDIEETKVVIESAKYRDISDCYNSISEYEEACKYCKKANGYLRKEERKELDCTAFGCASESSGSSTSGSEIPSNTSSSTSSSGTGGLPITSMAIIGLILLVLLGLILFVLKKRNQNKV